MTPLAVPEVGAYVETRELYSRTNPLLPYKPLRGWVESVEDFDSLDFVMVFIRDETDPRTLRMVIVSPDRPDPFLPGTYDLASA